MNNAECPQNIFISYAWGDGMKRKEWVRNGIVSSLDWKYPVFWDRDSIGFGESIDQRIAQALSLRPLTVFCLCDGDFLRASGVEGSGLQRELALLGAIAGTTGVRIIPVILEAEVAEHLPGPLQGLVYVNLVALHQRRLHLGHALLALTEGATQAQLSAYLKHEVDQADLRVRALAYMHQQDVQIWGNAHTHEVTLAPMQLLTAPAWMWESADWNYMLQDDNPDFCPAKGRWPWDYTSNRPRGSRALGAAVMSAFFPQCTAPAYHWALEAEGVALTIGIFSMTRSSEAFLIDGQRLVQELLCTSEGARALRHLLDGPTAL